MPCFSLLFFHYQRYLKGCLRPHSKQVIIFISNERLFEKHFIFKFPPGDRANFGRSRECARRRYQGKPFSQWHRARAYMQAPSWKWSENSPENTSGTSLMAPPLLRLVRGRPAETVSFFNGSASFFFSDIFFNATRIFVDIEIHAIRTLQKNKNLPQNKRFLRTIHWIQTCYGGILY